MTGLDESRSIEAPEKIKKVSSGPMNGATPDWPKFLESVIDVHEYPSRRSILDIGCGDGFRLQYAHEKGWGVFGVETDGVLRARAKLRTGLICAENLEGVPARGHDLILVLDPKTYLGDPHRFFCDLLVRGAVTPQTRVLLGLPSGDFSEEPLREALKSLNFSKIDFLKESPLGIPVCHAGQNDFTESLRGYSVHGTSDISFEENWPRYLFAKKFCAGAHVLDIACGTGYGAQLLAAEASGVLAVDKNETALRWACAHHAHERLSFQRSDHGEGVYGSFDVITCFAALERLDARGRQAALAKAAGLLKVSGKFIASIPNVRLKDSRREAYDINEFSERKFTALLKQHFRHVAVLKQIPGPAVLFSEGKHPDRADFSPVRVSGSPLPSGFIALCSESPLGPFSPDLFMDFSGSQTLETVRLKNLLTESFEEISRQAEKLRETEKQLAVLKARQKETVLPLPRQETAPVFDVLRTAAEAEKKPWFLRLVPKPSPAFKPYRARILKPILSGRPRILHVIGNFKTGGSSRLVVDLFERLGHRYRQEVITSFMPDRVQYTGLNVHRLEGPEASKKIRDFLRRFSPDLAHVHYWGMGNRPWYERFFKIAEDLDLPVIENVNVPVIPFRSPAVRRYVYVSEYVRSTFGEEGPAHEVIYPGSDFDLFRKSPKNAEPDSIGMVYRLEPDKLDTHSIEPFILAAKQRPSLKALIVGGGPLLDVYQKAVAKAGVEKSFEFTGYVSYDALPSYYRRMKVFVAPVWQESFGHVTPLAMGLGIPVIGYNVGALAEITGDLDCLVPRNDSRALADLIVRLDSDGGERASAAFRQSRAVREKFSVQSMVESYENLYETLLRVKK